MGQIALEKARKENIDIDVKSTLKALSFNIGGHILHSIFWTSMAPAGKGGGTPGGVLADKINAEFGSFERFKKEFTEAAFTVEGSGWAALTYCKNIDRILIMHIEKHNVNVFPNYPILVLVDVFEHAYYVDYRNDRRKYLENWWNLVNWSEVDNRLQKNFIRLIASCHVN